MEARDSERVRCENQDVEHKYSPWQDEQPRSELCKMRSVHCITTYGNTSVQMEGI